MLEEISMDLSHRNKPKDRLILFAALAVLLALSFLLFLRFMPASYAWVMDRGERLNEDYLVKMCPNGVKLIMIQFGQSGAIGADPNTGNIWAPELNDRGYINENQILKYDAEGNLLARYQGYRSSVIAVDPNDGSVWVGLVNENQVVRLDSEGEPILVLSGFQAPRSIAVDQSDNSIWVADDGRNDKLVHLSVEGADLFRTPTEGFFSDCPHQIAVDPHTRNVWYSGSFIESVFLLSNDGELLAEISGFDSPVAIAVSPHDSSAWVADFSIDQTGAVVKLDSSGQLLLRKVLEKPPRSIAVDPFGKTVWVGIEGALVILSPQGDISETFSDFNMPYSFAFVEIPNTFSAKVDYLRSCFLRVLEDRPITFLKDTPTISAITPVMVSASPMPSCTLTIIPPPSSTPIP
jgi:DNA-binding beta-propeller fold protein YncE